MAREIKIGNDKQPAPLVEANVPLYNLQTGEILVDEGGTPLVSREDTFLTSETSSKKSTSIVYTKDKPFTQTKNVRLKGKNFSAQDKVISAAPGTGKFKGSQKYRVSFSSAVSLDGLATGTQINLVDTIQTGEIEAVQFTDTNLSFGVLVIINYSFPISIGDQFEYDDGGITKSFTCLDVTSLKEEGELSIGDLVLLPTGLTGDTKVYETRVVSRVIDDDSFEVSLEVTSNLDLFGELIKLVKNRIDPVLKVAEEFPEFSEVSSTILGIPKAEEQLGLFSNVSSYGLDEDDFLFYTDDSAFGGEPTVWTTRKNRLYGNHYRSQYVEETDESAIILRSYRTPYGYPFGPRGSNGYNSEQYPKFNTFLKLGCLLYDEFKDTNPGYANNFLRYVANHVTLGNVAAGDGSSRDELDNVINVFLPEENIIRLDTNEVVGTVYAYRFVTGSTGVLHFNEEVGYLLSEYIDEIKNTNPNSPLLDDPLIPIRGETSGATANIQYDLTYNDDERFFSNLVTPLNPAYSSQEDFFSQVDTWTEIYRDIVRNSFTRPSGSPFNNDYVRSLPSVQRYLIEYKPGSGSPLFSIPSGTNIFSDQNTRPGYSTVIPTRAYLESRKAFRYQPGRISGYTFGVRASNDAVDDNNVILEWGIGNETDDLLFQIRGASFSIVRRSVVPFTDALLEENGLDPQDQRLITKDSKNNTVFTGIENKQVYEIVVGRDNWNGDPLNGNGPSGYFWEADKVTMYKIEFGWYGAIGIQFYAYVPIENGEARWVKLHRFVIENKLGEPCMGDPYYKFKYKLSIDDFFNVRTPQFIYKYGTSCYIDGGDEGTISVNTATSDVKTAPIETAGVQRSTSLVSIQPKSGILNPLGILVKNKKLIFPREISVNTEGLLELSIVKCKSCPGFGYTYQPNVNSEVNGSIRLFKNPPLGDAVDRSKVELPKLTKNASASTTNTITLDDVQYLREGDIVDPDGDNTSIPTDTLIVSIIGNEITLSNNLTGSVSGDIEIQPVFLQKDYFAKLIATRVWNTYIGEFDTTGESLIQISGEEDRYKIANLTTTDPTQVSGTQTKNAILYQIERELPSLYKIPAGRSVAVVPTPIQFPGRLSQYDKIVASPIPVSGRKNNILFLSTFNNDSGIYAGGHGADWRIGVTSLRPQSDGSGGIEWFDNQNNPKQLTDDLKLYAEYFSEGIFRDIDGFEAGETSFGRIRPFTVDYRIPRPVGTNTGICSFLNITVNPAQFFVCDQIRGSELLPNDSITTNYPSFDANNWYIRTEGSFPFTYDVIGAEVGFNPTDPTGSDQAPDIGSGVTFTSNAISYNDVDEEGNRIDYQLIELSTNLPGQTQDTATPVTLWYVPVSLETFRKLVTRTFNFNPFPLYFFIEMRDSAAINGAVIKEIGQVTNSYNPNWISSNGMIVSNDNIAVGPIGDTKTTTGNLTDIPPNFIDKNRLSSALVDVQNQSQIRPYEIIDKVYVGQGTKTLSLKNIFDYNKEAITPDLLNTTAYFILATSKENNSVQVQSTLNYIEQQ
jgi:hypothetical protein